jgi:acyl-CoA synthetase (AMP-forming)/AMP-acid ligase II
VKPDSGNFGELIHEAVKLVPDKIAIHSEYGQLTYRELDARMNRAGHLFRSLGVAGGDRVALLFPNDYRFIEICFGLMRIGAVPLPMNTKLSLDALSYIVQDSGAKVLAYHRSLDEKAGALLAGRPDITAVAVGEADGSAVNSSQAAPLQVDYDKRAADMSDRLDAERVKDDDLCFLLYTSGSTGRPKGCMLTHGGQWWNADTNRKVLMIDADDRSLISVPLYHKNAMINAVKPCLMAGASMVILPGFRPEDVVAAIEKYRVTYTTGVPAMYKLILNYYKEHPDHDVSSLRFAVCGSSEVPQELMHELQHTFRMDVLEAYGLTEGGPQVLISPRWGVRRQGSSGLPLPGSQVRISAIDDAERELPAGETGELWVKNPGIAKGYWNLPEVTHSRFTPDGWLKTGDLARLDEDGFGYIVGRKDDMINVGGENVYPKEVENILLSHPDIQDVCVVAMRHEIKGKAPAAFVLQRTGANLTEKAVQDYFLGLGPAYAHPRKVLFIASMPLSGTGKVDKAALTAMLEQGGNEANGYGS